MRPLAEMDELRPATLDPAVWSANLAALAVEQPLLAEELRALVLPETWRPALAPDGFVTYRTEQPGAPAAWLGQTAAPLVRARSRLERLDVAGKNPALPTCGTGAEVHFLLSRLPGHLAVFVFETDRQVLAAVLHTQDWSAAITQGRCVLVPPAREYAFLTELMERSSGLLPPAEILLPDLVAPARVAELRAIGERVNRETTQRRDTHLRALGNSVVPSSRTPGDSAVPPRLALLALRPQSAALKVAEGLERAARRLEWPVLRCATADPRNVHPLPHCRAVAEFRPDLTIYVGGPRPRLPLATAGTTSVWVLDELESNVELPGDDTLYLAASPTIAASLERAGIPADAILDWFWACEAPTGAAAPATAEDPVVLVGDLPDPRPETCGIQRSAHKKLWAQLGRMVAQTWESPRIGEPGKLLVRAERECQVDVRDPELREALQRLVERVLIPAVVLEHIAQMLTSEAGLVLTLGRGWGRIAAGNLKPLAASLFDLSGRDAELHPRACVMAGQRDPLSPPLLHAAARGWPLLVHALGGQSLAPALGNVLQPRQHFAPFSDRSELRRCLQLLREQRQANQEQVERTRRHVAEKHTCLRRLQDLRAFLDARPARANP
jgi:hypothetical protein